MKTTLKMIAACFMLALTACAPAAANQSFLISRGTDINTGFVGVTYTINGDRMQISRADLEAAGVNYFNLGEVASYLNVSGGGFGGGCGADAAGVDPDGGPGSCNLDDGVAGTVGAEAGGARW